MNTLPIRGSGETARVPVQIIEPSEEQEGVASTVVSSQGLGGEVDELAISNSGINLKFLNVRNLSSDTAINVLLFDKAEGPDPDEVAHDGVVLQPGGNFSWSNEKFENGLYVAQSKNNKTYEAIDADTETLSLRAEFYQL